MKDLLLKVAEAHGGLKRWSAFDRVQANIVSIGKLFEFRGFPLDNTVRQMTVWLHHQQASVQPFGSANRKTTFQPGRIAIENLNGEVLLQRTGTPGAIHEHMTGESWDHLDRAYFNGYALWLYLTTPFCMFLPGFSVKEIEPVFEEGEQWQGLRVTFPDDYASHCKVQDFYFGPDFLIRRHDYMIDVAGNFQAIQYLSDIKEQNGIFFATKRRAYKKGEDGTADRNQLMVSIDLSDFRFISATE